MYHNITRLTLIFPEKSISYVVNDKHPTMKGCHVRDIEFNSNTKLASITFSKDNERYSQHLFISSNVTIDLVYDYN